MMRALNFNSVINYAKKQVWMVHLWMLTILKYCTTQYIKIYWIQPVSLDGSHGLSFRRSADHPTRHSAINGILAKAFKLAETSVALESLEPSRATGAPCGAPWGWEAPWWRHARSMKPWSLPTLGIHLSRYPDPVKPIKNFFDSRDSGIVGWVSREDKVHKAFNCTHFYTSCNWNSWLVGTWRYTFNFWVE